MVNAGKYTSPMDPMVMKPWEEDTTFLGKWRTIDERNPPKPVVKSSSLHYICRVFMMLVFSHIFWTINEVSLAKCSFEHVGDRWVYRPPEEATLAFDSRLQVDREQWTEHWEKDTKRNTFLWRLACFRLLGACWMLFFSLFKFFSMFHVDEQISGYPDTCHVWKGLALQDIILGIQASSVKCKASSLLWPRYTLEN